jgi:DNA-binding Xre family transcriptional regulator
MDLKLNIKQIAQKRGLSKARLSRKADLDPRTIDRVWKDASENIEPVETDTLNKIAEALEVTIKELIAEE